MPTVVEAAVAGTALINALNGAWCYLSPFEATKGYFTKLPMNVAPMLVIMKGSGIASLSIAAMLASTFAGGAKPTQSNMLAGGLSWGLMVVWMAYLNFVNDDMLEATSADRGPQKAWLAVMAVFTAAFAYGHKKAELCSKQPGCGPLGVTIFKARPKPRRPKVAHAQSRARPKPRTRRARPKPRPRDQLTRAFAPYHRRGTAAAPPAHFREPLQVGAGLGLMNWAMMWLFTDTAVSTYFNSAPAGGEGAYVDCVFKFFGMAQLQMALTTASFFHAGAMPSKPNLLAFAFGWGAFMLDIAYMVYAETTLLTTANIDFSGPTAWIFINAAIAGTAVKASMAGPVGASGTPKKKTK